MKPLWLLGLACAASLSAADAPTPAPAPVRPKSDAAGNPIRYAATGHVSNYDESKVGAYTLPDLLKMRDGTPVRDAETWTKKRRPEILKLYESEIYGRVPARTPKVTFAAVDTDAAALAGTAILKRIEGRLGEAADAPKVHVRLYLPAKASGPVPVLLHLQFFGGGPFTAPVASAATTLPANTADAKAPAAKQPRPSEDGPIADILARGYGYATVRYTEFEGDSANANLTLLRKLSLAAGQEKPAADEWGTVAAWAWGASRILDHFETDRAIDARRIGIIGHSRLGKTVLWAGASDPRWALVFSSCSGEMGASLARRDWGESVDDMAANFGWQFAGNFQKYPGKWNEMPVDSHMLIALSAPRPVFVTGGTTDQWADPKGEFLAQVEAGAVYRLLGRTDLGVKELPPLDTPIITGHLGWHYHTGGHTITPSDWKAFLDFAQPHLRPSP